MVYLDRRPLSRGWRLVQMMEVGGFLVHTVVLFQFSIKVNQPLTRDFPMPPNRNAAHGKPCPYCGRTMDRFSERLRPTWDHVIPQALGGCARIVCCCECNGIKADMLPAQWASFMAANPEWWNLSRLERRAARRANREWVRTVKWGPRHRQRQGSPPPGPVIVPPHLIFGQDQPADLPISASS